MRIVVLVKPVLDTYGARKLDPETGLAVRPDGAAVVDEICERALELALNLVPTLAGTPEDHEVVVLAMTPHAEGPLVRKSLATGATRAVHIADEALLGADIVQTGQVLAAALTQIGFDLIIAGSSATDGTSGMVPAAVAEVLGVPLLPQLTAVEVGAEADAAGVRVIGERTVDGGSMRVSAQLPALVSVTEALPAGRFPSFKGIVAAKKKPVEELSLSDLSLNGDPISTPRAIMVSLAERPARSTGTKVVYDGTAGDRVVEFLAGRRLV